ncbi:MAG: TIGR00730 family Rossman fold protein [Leucothrix sp.]
MKRICVYCGSSYGKLPIYTDTAKALGKVLTDNNIGLVYGGASVGIMGVVADAVLAGGGEVIGVIPQAIADKEIAHTGLSQLEVVPNMHERKAMMADFADGFIALPGGLGTMEELFEVWTWSQLGFHQKPCGLMNVAGYYDHLTAFIDHAVDQEYVKAVHQEALLVATDPADLIQQMTNYRAAPGSKWIGRDDL